LGLQQISVALTWRKSTTIKNKLPQRPGVIPHENLVNCTFDAATGEGKRVYGYYVGETDYDPKYLGDTIAHENAVAYGLKR